MTVAVRALEAADADALDAFLRRHADTSMFLRSNAWHGGLTFRNTPMQCAYFAALDRGTILAVAAHCWNGMLLVQAPGHIEAVTRAAVGRSGLAIAGVTGPWDQVVAACETLGLTDRAAIGKGRQDLYALPLHDPVIPAALAEGRLSCRPPRADELDLVAAWRRAFCVEALELADTPSLAIEARNEILRLQDEGSHWVVLDGATPVSYAAFNARLPDAAQVGGEWTPPELRGRGFGRAAVAGALVAARAEGVARGVLFTRAVAARRVYLAIGFRRVGDYGLVQLREPVTPP